MRHPRKRSISMTTSSSDAYFQGIDTSFASRLASCLWSTCRYVVYGTVINATVVAAICISHGTVVREYDERLLLAPSHTSILYVTTRLGYQCINELRVEPESPPIPLSPIKRYDDTVWWTSSFPEPSGWITHIGIGWPLISMRAYVTRDYDSLPAAGAIGRPYYSLHSGVLLTVSTSRTPWIDTIPQVLPYRPVWPGMIVDSTVFAALIGLVHTVWLASRRARRRRRNECEQCGYSRGESCVCSECGSPLSQPAAPRPPFAAASRDQGSMRTGEREENKTHMLWKDHLW